MCGNELKRNKMDENDKKRKIKKNYYVTVS